MRINVYSQELTDEVAEIKKSSNTGDDDRSAVTFWLPQSRRGLTDLLKAFSKAMSIVNAELSRLETKAFNDTYDANARRRGQYE